MQCNSCDKNIDIEKEWLKKPLLVRVKDSIVFWFDFINYFKDSTLESFFISKDRKFLSVLLKVITQAVLFVAMIFSFIFGIYNIFYPVFYPIINIINQVIFNMSTLPSLALFISLNYIVEGIIFIVIFLFLNYLAFKVNLKNNLELLMVRSKLVIKCSNCNEKINLLKS